MAAPTEDEIQAQINQLVWILEKSDVFLRSATDNVAGMYDEFIALPVEGDFAVRSLRGLDSYRALASSLVNPATARTMLDPLIREYGKQQGLPETEVFAIFNRLADYFAGGSERVTTRDITFGSVSAGGGNTGDGAFNRLTVDKNAHDIEAITTETKSFKCIADRYSGAQIHREVFEIRGADVPRDYAAGIVGAQRIGSIQAISADDSQAFVSNPSFSQYTGTAPDITEITNWTVGSAIGNFQIETSDVYRTAVHEGTSPGAVRFETNETLTQALSIVNPTLARGVPYYAQIAFKRESSCDGTLTLAVGGNSANVSLVAQSGWTILRLALDENLFFENFNATTLTVVITLGSRTTGALLVDDLVIAPMTQFDGTWWALVGGATPWLVDDTATATDSATDSILQKWLWRIYGRYLPHDTTASGNVTWAEPS